MGNLKILWWLIVVVILAYIVYEFGIKESYNKCFRFENNSTDEPTIIYCKRGEKFYATITGGFTGGEKEYEISEQEYKTAMKKYFKSRIN